MVGGTDLLVGLRHHTLEPSLIVDLKGVTDLPEPILVTDDGVQVGPTYTLGELVAPPLLVHGARVTIASLDGERTASLDEFFLGPRRTLCGPGELVVRIDLPRPPAGTSSAFRRLTRRRGVDLATVSVAAAVGADGALTLGMGAVGPGPMRTAVPG